MSEPRLTADREQALDHLGTAVDALPAAEREGFMFLALAILASNAPDVAHFILDRASERMAGK